jgi:hypothetical protein
LREPPGDRVHLCARRFERDSLFESAGDVVAAVVARILRHVELQRHPDLRALREDETFGHDAGDFEAPAVHLDSFANDVGV